MTVVVIGGANIDIKAQSTRSVTAATSNPGRTTTSAGGVGRNIAENLARLGTTVELVAAIGVDPYGDRLLAETSAAGVGLDHVLRSTAPTGTYTAVLDADGELVVAIADMAAVDELDASWLRGVADLLEQASYVVLDGNLSADVIETALGLAAKFSLPVLIDPVSDPKAARLAITLDAGPVAVITPNASELAALTGLPTTTDDQLRVAAAQLHTRGVSTVWIRLGDRGSIVSSQSAASEDQQIVEVAAVPADVVDVTGAGDAMAGAFVHARLSGASVIQAAQFAHAAAALTIESEHTVRPDITPTRIEQMLT